MAPKAARGRKASKPIAPPSVNPFSLAATVSSLPSKRPRQLERAEEVATASRPRVPPLVNPFGLAAAVGPFEKAVPTSTPTTYTHLDLTSGKQAEARWPTSAAGATGGNADDSDDASTEELSQALEQAVAADEQDERGEETHLGDVDPVFSWSGDRFLEERFWPLLRLVSEAEEEEEEARAPLCQLVSTIDRAKSSVDGTPTQLSSVATEWNTPDAGVKRIWGGFVSAVEQQEEGVDLSEMVAPDGPLNPDIIMVLHYPTETCGSNMRKFGTVVDTVNPTTARLDHAVNGLSGVLVFDIRPIRLRPGCPAPPDLRDPAAAKLPIYKFTNPPLTLQKSLTRLMDELLCSLLAEAKAKVGVI